MIKFLIDNGAHTKNTYIKEVIKLYTPKNKKEIDKLIEPLLKESLNEKFFEDSDVIHDLGIGVEAQIEKFLNIKNIPLNLFSDKYGTMLIVCAKFKKLDYVKYLINSKKIDVNFNHSIPLLWAIANDDIPMIKFLIKNGAKTTKQEVEDVYNNGIYRFKNKNVINKLIKPGLKESLNEKFTEDSDPIQDMGIGMKTKLEKWCKENYIEVEDEDEVLYQCAGKKQYDFAKYLISKGLDTVGRWSPYAALKNATLHNDLQMMRILIDAGSDPCTIRDTWYLNDREIKDNTKNFIRAEQKKWKKTHRSKKLNDIISTRLKFKKPD